MIKDGERFIVLFRHGIAEERSAEKPDGERELTGEGHRRMKEIGRGLKELLPKADALYSSPLRRALQTSEWIARAYDRRLTIEATAALAPESDAARFRQLLAAIAARRPIFVGHEPTLSAFMLALTGIQSAAMELKKGGCYGIRVGAGSAYLEWMLPPRAMRV